MTAVPSKSDLHQKIINISSKYLLGNYWRRLHELHLKRRNKINYYTNTSMTRKHKYISLRHLFSFYLLSIHQGYGRRVQYITESSMFHKIVFILWYVKSLKKCNKIYWKIFVKLSLAFHDWMESKNLSGQKSP